MRAKRRRTGGLRTVTRLLGHTRMPKNIARSSAKQPGIRPCEDAGVIASCGTSHRVNLLSPPWSPPEDAILRRHLRSRGTAYVARRVGRSLRSVMLHAWRLGISRQPRWNDIERRVLRNLWGESPLHVIAKKLGRSEGAVYEEARRVGLSRVPTGMELLSVAARRTGFAEETLRVVLDWAGVELRWPARKPSKKRRRHVCVDTFEVNEAVERWLATEALAPAARSRGLYPQRLARLLVGIDGVPPRPCKGRIWRIPSDVIDRALAADRRAA
jgi:hypothetical protein